MRERCLPTRCAVETHDRGRECGRGNALLRSSRATVSASNFKGIDLPSGYPIALLVSHIFGSQVSHGTRDGLSMVRLSMVS
jgi:hypothetical protein